MKKLLVIVVLVLVGYGVYNWINPATDYPVICQSTVVGNCSNSSAILEFNREEFQRSLKETCMNEKSQHVIVRADGNPKVTNVYEVPDTNLRNPSESKKQQLSSAAMDDILSELYKTKAIEPETDVIDAMHEALRAMDNDADVKKLVIVHNLLSTSGVLDFTDFNYNLSPKDVVAGLKKLNALPDFTGVDIEIYGFCATTSPQKNLSYDQRSYIKAIYEEIFREGNAKSCKFYEVASRDYKADKTLPKVSVISVPKVENVFSGSLTLTAENGVYFIGDTAEFVDESKVIEAIGGVLSFLNEDSTHKILVIGTTASGDREYCLQLSERRADAVKRLLVEMGAPATKISVLGVGDLDPYRIEDTDSSNGSHVEHLAAMNRKVIILDMDSERELVKEYYEAIN